MKLTFSRALAEFVIILLGVLAALAADSAMDNHRLRQETREALEALREDIAGDLQGIESYFVPQLQLQEESRRRLDLFLRTSEPIEDPLQFVNDVRLVSIYHTLDANRIGLEDLISSGGLSLIANPELREALRMYRVELDNIQEFDVLHRAYFLEVQGNLGPRIVGGMALPYSLDETLELIDPDYAVEEAANALDAERIRASDDLRLMLVQTHQAQRIKQVRYMALRNMAQRLIDLLDKALADS